jgi:hypothetical protein
MSYFVEWAAALIAPAIVIFLLVPGLVVIAVVIGLIILAVLAVALAAAIVASPYLLGSFLRERWRALGADGRRPALEFSILVHSRGSRLIARRPR